MMSHTVICIERFDLHQLSFASTPDRLKILEVVPCFQIINHQIPHNKHFISPFFKASDFVLSKLIAHDKNQ